MIRAAAAQQRNCQLAPVLPVISLITVPPRRSNLRARLARGLISLSCEGLKIPPRRYAAVNEKGPFRLRGTALFPLLEVMKTLSEFDASGQAT
jgi:hypothetical protein